MAGNRRSPADRHGGAGGVSLFSESVMVGAMLFFLRRGGLVVGGRGHGP